MYYEVVSRGLWVGVEGGADGDVVDLGACGLELL